MEPLTYFLIFFPFVFLVVRMAFGRGRINFNEVVPIVIACCVVFGLTQFGFLDVLLNESSIVGEEAYYLPAVVYKNVSNQSTDVIENITIVNITLEEDVLSTEGLLDV